MKNLLILFFILQATCCFAQFERTSDSGPFLKATIDGKPWLASDMVIDRDDSNIVEVKGRNGKTFISFNLYKPAQGKEQTFSRTSPANWSDDSDLAVYVGDSGKVTVTKLDAQWIEGLFSFTGVHEGKSVSVVDGKFKIPNPRKSP